MIEKLRETMGKLSWEESFKRGIEWKVKYQGQKQSGFLTLQPLIVPLPIYWILMYLATLGYNDFGICISYFQKEIELSIQISLSLASL